MNCKDAQNLINGYVDGELDLVRNLEIEHHIQECALCTQELQKPAVAAERNKNWLFLF
jgi:anti-sigma factor RsiW